MNRFHVTKYMTINKELTAINEDIIFRIIWSIVTSCNVASDIVKYIQFVIIYVNNTSND